MGNRVLFAVVIALGLGFLLTYPAIKLAKLRGFIDVPTDDRRMHVTPTPRIGGVAVFVAFAVALAVTGYFKSALPYLCGGLVIVAVGMIDDKRGITPMFKIAGQALAAAVLCAFGITARLVTFFGVTFELFLFAYPLTLAIIVVAANTVNLIDGVDGLCTGISVLISGAIAMLSSFFGDGSVAPIALVLCLACLGFLPHNASPATVFLGDAGSMLLGFLLAAFSIKTFLLSPADSNASLSAFIPIALLGIPLFDTAFAVVRRKLNGQRLFEGDKKHVHHRMTQRYGVRVGVALMCVTQAMLVGIAFMINLGIIWEIVGASLLVFALIYAVVRFGVYKK